MIPGDRVRVLRTIELGDDFRVSEGDVGLLLSTCNGPYFHYLVLVRGQYFAAAEGEIGEADLVRR